MYLGLPSLGLRPSGGGPTTDPDAAAWGTAVTAAGGTYSASTLSAMSTFAKAAKASGYWDKLNRINLFAGDQLTAALVPLKVGGGSTTETNVNFVAGDYTEATGLTGNGTTKYLNTGLTPSVSLVMNDTHLTVYNRSANATGANTALGARDGTNYLEFFAPNNDGIAYSRAGDVTVLSGAVAAPYGSLVATRPSSTSHTIYRQGAQVATTAVASAGALINLPVFVFALNSAGSPTLYSAQVFAAYSIGSGLSAADVTAYNTHLEAFQDALGRGVQ